MNRRLRDFVSGVMGSGMRIVEFYADRFIRADGSLGDFDGGLTGTWDQTTFTIASNKPVNTPTVGSELVSNGDFAAWTLGNPDWWTVVEAAPDNEITETGGGAYGSGGAGQCNFYYASGAELRLVRNTIMTIGVWYCIEFDVNHAGGGQVQVSDEAGKIWGIFTTTGHKKYYQQAAGTQINFRTTTAGTDITVDNVSIKAVTFPSLFATEDMGFSDGEFRVRVETVAGQPCGLALNLDSNLNPQNYIIAYVHPGQTSGVTKLYITQCLAGVLSELVVAGATINYVANAELVVSKTSTTYAVYYNGALISTVTGNAAITSNTRHGIFQTVTGLSSFLARKTGNYPACTTFFGGSVTVGSNATAHEKTSWRGLTGAWLEANQKDALYYNLSSAVDGRFSWAHLFNVTADAVTRKAGLVLLDFAVNDLNTNICKFSEEALIRRLLAMSPRPKIVGVNLIRVTNVAGNDATNQYQTTEDNLVALYTHYGIPIADVCSTIQTNVAGGTPLTTYFDAADAVHMIDAGHALAAGLVEAQLASLDPIAAIPERLLAGSADYENTPIVRAGTANDGETGTWATTGGIRQSATAGSTMAFTGTFQSFGLDAGGGTGTLQYSIDGGAYSANTPNGSLTNGVDLTTRAEHTITFQVISGTVKINNFLAI